jgi:hypothetical protein
MTSSKGSGALNLRAEKRMHARATEAPEYIMLHGVKKESLQMARLNFS